MTPSYSDRIVCFVDILGFSELIKQADTEQKGLEIIKTLEEALTSDLIAPVKNQKASTEEAKHTIRVFSDCICVSAPNTLGGMLVLIAQMASAQNKLLRRSILLRGAISVGLHYESDSMILSSALVSAYRMEKSNAFYPRIIIDPALIRLHYGGALNETKKKLSKVWIMKDSDNQYFVGYNPFIRLDEAGQKRKEQYFKKHRTVILALIDKHKNEPCVMNKLAWTQRYHNYSCQRDFNSQITLMTQGVTKSGFSAGI